VQSKIDGFSFAMLINLARLKLPFSSPENPNLYFFAAD